MRKSIINAIMGNVTDLRENGLVDDITMKNFESLCVPDIHDFKPEDIKAIRIKNHLSQAAFAALLNISSSTVQKWERGKKSPSGPTKKLLDIMERKGLDAFI